MGLVLKSKIYFRFKSWILASLFCCGTSGATVSQWQAGQTWVFMVAVEEWEHKDIYADMPDPNREDRNFYKVLIDQGVPKEQIVYLIDREATLKNIQSSFTNLLKQTQEGDTLITYFTGHGFADKKGRGYFANYDAERNLQSVWAVADMYRSIEREFKGNKVITLGDCCNSGTLVTQMKTLKTKKGYASMSSSLSTCKAGMYWTFTESLISGFTGCSLVDINADGMVSLQELRQYAYEEVGIFMQQEIQFGTNSKFPSSFNLSKTRPGPKREVGAYLELKLDPKKERWRKSRVVDRNANILTIRYYENDLARSIDLDIDSKQIRKFSRNHFKVSDLVEVKDGGRWYSARIVSVDENTGFHKVRYGKKLQWEALFLFDDMRMKNKLD